MDKQPFFTFNLFDFGEQDVKVLKYFRKNSFDTLILSNLAEEMRYKSQSRQTIKNIIECPDDDFIRYVLSLIHEGKKTQQLVDRLRPIIKSSIDTVIDEMVKEKIEQALANLKEVANNPISSDDDPVANEIKTTKEELEAFFNIKYILRNTVPWDKLHYRDAKSYFSILYDNKNYKWICRLRVEKTNKYIIFPDGTPSGKSYPIEDLNDIFAFGDEIIESAKRFVEEQ